MRRVIFYLIIFHLIPMTLNAYEYVGSSSYSRPTDSSRQEQALQTYTNEVKCILENNYSKADEKQKNRAIHFTHTLASFAGNWNPPLKASWRRHMYAQFARESGFFDANKEVDPSQSKIAGGEQYKGRGWIQITHDGNYGLYSCFKQRLDQTSMAQVPSLEYAESFIRNEKACNYENIKSNPEQAFKYNDNARPEDRDKGNINNDLSAVWFFLHQAKQQSTFARALDGISAEDVKKIRRGVNRGDSNDTKEASQEKEAIDDFEKFGKCINRDI